MSLSLAELKKKPPTELAEIARSMDLDGLGRMRKQDQIFAILVTFSDLFHVKERAVSRFCLTT